MAEFDVGEFLRQKRIQDAINAHDPNYNPDDATHWIAAAQKIQSPPDVTSAPPINQTNLAQPVSDSGTVDPAIGDQAIGTPAQSQEETINPIALDKINRGKLDPFPSNFAQPQFKPPAIGPEETAYRQQLVQTPLRSDYHPGKLRQILGGLAGVSVGLNTSDPNKAFAAEDTFKDAPYNKRLSEFNQGLGIQQQKAQAEIGDVSRAATQQELEARRQAEEERAAAERARRDKFVYDTSQTAHDRKLEELRTSHPNAVVFHEAKFKDNSIHYLKRDAVTGKLVDTDTNLPVDMNAVDTLSDPNKSLKQTQDEKIPAALQASIKAREIVADPKQQGTPAFEAAQEYIKNLSQGKDPKTAFDAVKDKTNEERKAKGLPEMSSSELTSLAKQLQPAQGPFLIDPSTNTLIRGQAGQVLPQGVVTPQQSGQEQTRKSKALEEMEADRDFVNGYIERGAPTGPDDEALLERFFNATKPSSGFRMNAQQIKLLTDLRSLKSRISAGFGRLTGGTLFDDTQRKQVAQAINDMIDAKTRAIKGGVGPVSSPKTSNDGWSVKVVK